MHKHNFKKDGNNLWCECGKVKRLECDHKWKLQSSNNIIIFKNNQIQEIWVCKVCGKYKKINPISGTISN